MTITQTECKTETRSLTPTASLGTTPAINCEGFRGGVVYVDDTTTAAWYASASEGGTFYAAQDKGGTALSPTTLTAAKCYALPADLFGAGWIKVTSSAAAAITITLKS